MIKFISEKGFSLIEVLIASALLTGVGIASYKLIGDQKKSIRQMTQSSDLDSFHKKMSTDLLDFGNCSASIKSFVGTPVSSANLNSFMYCANCTDPNGKLVIHNSVNSVVPSTKFILSIDRWIDDMNNTGNSKKRWRVKSILKDPKFNPATESGPLRLDITYEENPAVGTKQVMKQLYLPLKYVTHPTSGLMIAGCLPSSESTASQSTFDLQFCRGLPAYFKYQNNSCESIIDINDCPQGRESAGVSGDASCRTSIMQSDFEYVNHFSPTPVQVDGPKATAAIQLDGIKYSLISVNGAPQTVPNAPVNCAYTWGQCSKSCGRGFQTLAISTAAANNGDPCPGADGDTRVCNTQACDVDCDGVWSTCVDGEESFTVSEPQQGNGLACPTSPRSCTTPPVIEEDCYGRCLSDEEPTGKIGDVIMRKCERKCK